MEGILSLINKNTTESQLPVLHLGWIELKYIYDTGQQVYIQTVVKNEYPYVFHPKICKVDFLCQKIEFSANYKQCAGSNIEEGFWDGGPLQLSAVITNFDKMIPCPGIQTQEFQLLKNKNASNRRN